MPKMGSGRFLDGKGRNIQPPSTSKELLGRIIEWKTRPLYVQIMQSHIEEQAIFVLSIYVVSILPLF